MHGPLEVENEPIVGIVLLSQFISRNVSTTKIRADKIKTENEPNRDKATRQTGRSFRNSLPLPAFIEPNRHRDMSRATFQISVDDVLCVK
jgi:hypothetical protein